MMSEKPEGEPEYAIPRVVEDLMAGGIVLPEQKSSAVNWSPEKELAAAVLTDALVEIRVAIAALFLVGVLAWRRGMNDLPGAALPLTVVGVFSSALPFVLFAYSTLSVTAGTAALLNASAPLFGALVAYAWLRDKLTLARVIGLAVGFGGIVLLAWDKVSLAGGGSTLAILAAGIGALRTRRWAGWHVYTPLAVGLIPLLSILLLHPAFLPALADISVFGRNQLGHWVGAVYLLAWLLFGLALRAESERR